MISVVSLHWKRTDNTRLISQTLLRHPKVDEVIVWNNNPDVDTVDCAEGVTVINSSKDVGLNTRFAAAVLAANDCILTVDDDILPNSQTVTSLYSAWESSPEVIHTLHGKNPTDEDEYPWVGDPSPLTSVEGDSYSEARISLTRCTMYHKKFAQGYFEVEQRVRETNHSTLHNGEDIILSYLARSHSGSDVRVYDLEAIELPAPFAIHGRAGHREYRTLLLRRCQEFFQIP